MTHEDAMRYCVHVDVALPGMPGSVLCWYAKLRCAMEPWQACGAD